MRSLSLALRNFSSQWFLIPQGTGIIAILLHQLHYQFHGLETISEIVWVYTIALLATFLCVYTLRICIYPRHVIHELHYSITETSCLASIGIALTTIMQMVALTLVTQWGHAWAMVAYVLWWVVTAMAVIAVVLIPYIYAKAQPPSLMHVTPTMLLPAIAALTAAAAGGTLCVYAGRALGPALQGPVLVVTYLQIGAGLPMAMSIVGLFQARLVEPTGFPRLEHIYEDMILCGPFGQGSFALLIAGKAVLNASAASTASKYSLGPFLTPQSAGALGTASQFAGLLVWGYATFWWCAAVVGIGHTVIAQACRVETRRKMRFSMGMWSLVFPMVRFVFSLFLKLIICTRILSMCPHGL